VPATGIREIASEACACQLPGLRKRCRLVGEQFARRKIVHTVLAHPCVGREQQRGTQNAEVCQTHIKACHVLSLILPGRLLIVSVGDLEP